MSESRYFGTYHSITGKKKRKIGKENKSTFSMGEKIINNEITVLVFQFFSVFKWFVAPMSIEMDLFFSSVFHLTLNMPMKTRV